MSGVYDCKIWGTGLVVLTNSYRLFSVEFRRGFQKPGEEGLQRRALNNPGTRRLLCCFEPQVVVRAVCTMGVLMLPCAELTSPPHSWAVLEPQFSLSRAVEVMIATEDTILVVDSNTTQDQVPANGCIKELRCFMLWLLSCSTVVVVRLSTVIVLVLVAVLNASLL